MKTLTLRGEELRCIDEMPPGLLFDLADITGEQDTMKVMSAIGKFLRAIVIPEDRERFREILYDTSNVLSVEDLSEQAGELIKVYAGRPTSRPSDSPAGGSPTPPVSRVVSLSRGTVEEVRPSSKVGKSAAS